MLETKDRWTDWTRRWQKSCGKEGEGSCKCPRGLRDILFPTCRYGHFTGAGKGNLLRRWPVLQPCEPWQKGTKFCCLTIAEHLRILWLLWGGIFEALWMQSSHWPWPSLWKNFKGKWVHCRRAPETSKPSKLFGSPLSQGSLRKFHCTQFTSFSSIRQRLSWVKRGSAVPLRIQRLRGFLWEGRSINFFLLI